MRWYQEGMRQIHGITGSPAFGDTVRGSATPIAPGDKVCSDIAEGAALDEPSLRVPVNLFLSPGFTEKVLDESDEQVTVRDEYGIVKQAPKAKNSIPHFLSWPVKNGDDFERFADEQLNVDSPERFPKDWEERVKQLNEYDGVIALGGYPCGFFWRSAVFHG